VTSGDTIFRHTFFYGKLPLVGQGLFFSEALPSHSDTPHSVGLLWTSDQPDGHMSTRQHTTLIRDRQPCPGGILSRNPSKRAVADPYLRPRGHWIWFVIYGWNNKADCILFA